MVFVPSLVKLASRRVLASSLSFSAGVMTYVSFVEIFSKSNDSFVNAGFDENIAHVYATLCFFSGVLTMMALNVMVDYMIGEGKHHSGDAEILLETKKPTRESLDRHLAEDPVDVPSCPSCPSGNPVNRLDNVQRMADVLEYEMEDAAKQETKTGETVAQIDNSSQPVESQPQIESVEQEMVEDKVEDEEAQRLHKMGLNTAIAIGLHNFPEGLATFVAALDDPKVGAVLAVAIAIHNIPEGLCVALPIYYASGNRMKGFLWALLSGASEFFAALLGWVILANVFSETTYAILFGVVAGMMIMISMRELLPTAHVYDNKDTVVSYSFIVGMIVMALSLCLFQV